MYQSLYQQMCEEQIDTRGEKKKARYKHICVRGQSGCTYNTFLTRIKKGRTIVQAINMPRQTDKYSRLRSMGITNTNGQSKFQRMCEESSNTYWEEYKKKLAKIQRENKKAEETKKREKPDKVKE